MIGTLAPKPEPPRATPHPETEGNGVLAMLGKVWRRLVDLIASWRRDVLGLATVACRGTPSRTTPEYVRMTGRRNNVPTSRNACVRGEEAASHKVK